MKPTRTILLATVFLAIQLTGFSQQKQTCTDQSSVLTAYYSYSPNFKTAVGFEAGKLNNENPLGYFAGVSFEILNSRGMKSDTARLKDMVTDFYIKGSYRLTRIENFVSILAVASPRYSLEAGFDLQQGVRFVFPFSDRMAMGIEPLYAIRQNNFVVNFQLSFTVK